MTLSPAPHKSSVKIPLFATISLSEIEPGDNWVTNVIPPEGAIPKVPCISHDDVCSLTTRNSELIGMTVFDKKVQWNVKCICCLSMFF